MPESKVYIFDPKEDISIDLVARLLKNMYLNARIGFPKKVYDTFSEEDKIHFKEIEKSQIIQPGK